MNVFRNITEKVAYQCYQTLYVASSWRMRKKFHQWLNEDRENNFHLLEKYSSGAKFPKISIVILCYNNLEFTKMCVQSVLEKTIYPDFEVIMVDNASTDGTVQYLEDLCVENEKIRCCLLPENFGFSQGNNAGVEESTGDIIVFLNNDTIVTPAWLTKFEYHLRDPNIGLVGPAVNFSGNETQVPVGYKRVQEIDDFADFFTTQFSQPPFPIKVLPFHCVAMRRSTWTSVGELDPRYGLGMFEDDDYSLRVHNAGLQVVCADDIFIHHWGRQSFSKLEKTEHDQLFEENKRKFEEKWNVKWKPHKHRSMFPYLF